MAHFASLLAEMVTYVMALIADTRYLEMKPPVWIVTLSVSRELLARIGSAAERKIRRVIRY